MTLDFRWLSTVCAIVCFALALAWMFAPRLLLSMWSVEFSYPVGLVGRRGAALFAGIGVMFFSARSAGPSPARTALANGFSIGCMILAALGSFELATGHAGVGILAAVLGETALAVALLYVDRKSPAT